MPRTRSQRRADLATSLGEDAVSHILTFLPGLGAFPGRVYSLTGPPGAQSTERGGLSLKAILAPRRQAVLKVPDAYTMEEALAAARDGDVVLVTDDIELQAPIIAPAYHLIIAAATYRRYGNGFPERDTCRPGQQYLLGSTGPYIPAHPAVYVNTHAFPGGVSDHETTCAAVVAVGADVRLELRGIAFHGVAADDEWVEGAPVACAAVGAQDGADLVIENCWFSNLGTHSLRFRTGAKVLVQDVTINRSRYGIRAEGDGTSLVVENSRFNGPNVCAVGARVGAHVDVRWCSIDRIYSCALFAEGANAILRFDRDTRYMCRPVPEGGEGNDNEASVWPSRFKVNNGGRVCYPDAANEEFGWVNAASGDFGSYQTGDARTYLESFEELPGAEQETFSFCRSPPGCLFSSSVWVGQTQESRIPFHGGSGRFIHS